ncbi:hypothetical protein EIN_058320 [Entamoeba invadens IP1]|uniref:hypothetical protein n=1 Tax=Entamoeba invadens IP1 TaxID=370355 RepID=UPI0002C3F938|nr:hypothetical protein EIN_058320 [Entamoeba invadens IP1]ELP93387.1 hypothetical protein EIN_058320 [Entamoeba invadens IP1]|eukprot:XP_004260158.1 hypothetical protein EIN_058320 [Entamoeba invadens IP1]
MEGQLVYNIIAKIAGQSPVPSTQSWEKISNSQDQTQLPSAQQSLYVKTSKQTKEKKPRKAQQPLKHEKSVKLNKTTRKETKLLQLTQNNLTSKNLMGITRSMLNSRIEIWKKDAELDDALFPHPFMM